MGYDITFHAISQRELEHYVFDVLRDPSIQISSNFSPAIQHYQIHLLRSLLFE